MACGLITKFTAYVHLLTVLFWDVNVRYWKVTPFTVTKCSVHPQTEGSQ